MSLVSEPPTDRKKNDRLSIRISIEEKNSLTRAAAILHQDTGEFVRQAALLAAEKALAETSVLRLTIEEWDAFKQRLDESPRVLPRLQALLAEPDVFGG